ncbi:chromate transporter [Limnohabitans sp. Rim8]|jgi:chromate transporter|uniref:chromate transporter n=1 Tax=Limnohabitans sp. Rim8 TaxID=1100718 RepID=UPI000D36848A|nr:chromate transporter [Limnohabitans sp. Rim8]PUE61061.1 chromate transporter [Limnohabitans sp. Rim8]
MSDAQPLEHSTARHAPKNKTDLFVSFTVLALQGFGGVLAVVQRELVDKKKWLTTDEFVEDWSVAQILPGPNVVNLALMIGGRHFGIAGALAALSGLLIAPTVLVLLLAAAVAGVAETPVAQGMLRGMGAVSAGLIAAVGIKLMGALKNNPMGMLTCIGIGTLTFVAIGLLRLPLAWVLLSLGPLASVWAAHCIKQRDVA